MPRKKVKDMPRKQQMAVKAAMAEKAAGKKSPAKNKPKTKMLKGTTVFGKEVNKKNINKALQAVKKLSPTIDSKIKKFKKASALKMKKSPALAKLSASCKAAAKRKFKVYPSAYANMWAAKTQRQGKC
jgi:hypothetical protein